MASTKTTVGPATSRTSREHDSWCRAAEQQERREKREGAGLGIVDVEMARWPLAASRLVDCLTEPSLLADSSVPSAPLRESSMRLWEPVLPVCLLRT